MGFCPTTRMSSASCLHGNWRLDAACQCSDLDGLLLVSRMIWWWRSRRAYRCASLSCHGQFQDSSALSPDTVSGNRYSWILFQGAISAKPPRKWSRKAWLTGQWISCNTAGTATMLPDPSLMWTMEAFWRVRVAQPANRLGTRRLKPGSPGQLLIRLWWRSK